MPKCNISCEPDLDNSDRGFVDDPAGLSDDALIRRTEAVLSSALKHRTTRHLKPHERQIKSDAWLGVPALDWRNGADADADADADDIRELVKASIAGTFRAVPEAADARYDARPEPSALVKASPSLMQCFVHGVYPPAEIERQARGVQRLKEAFSSIRRHARKADRDPDYWNGLYTSQINW